MRRVAAFDFDGTLSTRDNVLPFMRAVAGTGGLVLIGLVLAPRVMAALVRDERRSALKAAATRRVFAGRDAAEITRIAGGFSAEVLARHLRPDVVERAEWHRSQGHERVIVSASFAAYLEPIARKLGFDAVLATELEVGAGGRLTGALAGPNCRREEKVRRLDAWLGGEPAEVWAYGNDRGDAELFARADHPVHV